MSKRTAKRVRRSRAMFGRRLGSKRVGAAGPYYPTTADAIRDNEEALKQAADLAARLKLPSVRPSVP